MPRTKIDFYPSRQDAADALSSLREVGLSPGDVGGAWLSGTEVDATIEGATATSSNRIVFVEDVGKVRFSGWLADAAIEALGHQPSAPLSAIFDTSTADSSEVARVRDTLVKGGGVVGVRASDAFSPRQD